MEGHRGGASSPETTNREDSARGNEIILVIP